MAAPVAARGPSRLALAARRSLGGRTPAGEHGGVASHAALAWRSPLDATPALFWLLASVGFLVATPTAFRLVDTATLAGWSGGVDPYLTLGVAATAPYSTVLRHGARETSFVVVWVAVAYVAWALVHTLTGFDGSQLPLLGVAGVLVGALVGLVPGCAVQIVFTGLYVSGLVPLPTLLANALSQDGDALLPLGLVVGTAALLLT